MALPDSVDGNAVSTPAGQDPDRDDSWNDLLEVFQPHYGNTNFDEDYEDDHGLFLDAHGAGALNPQDMSSMSPYTPAIDTNLSDDPHATTIPATQCDKPHCTMKKAVIWELGARKKSTANTPNIPTLQPGGRLLKLPPEIRLIIYEHMFPTEPISVHAIRGRLHKLENEHIDAGDHVAILATCRTIYEEAKPVLYTNIEFVMYVQDQYWLHFFSPEDYTFVFEVDEDMEPDLNDWTTQNPWLENPRSVIPLDNVRLLALVIEANASAEGRQWTWTEQLKHTLHEARHIQKLHIALECSSEEGFDQNETDETLRIVGETLRCSGTITGNMHTSAGSAGFASASYYHMLAGFGGVDRTPELFSKELAGIRSKRAKYQRLLDQKMASLRSATEERIEFTQEQSTWVGFADLSHVPRQLDDLIRGTLEDAMSYQNRLQHLQEKDASLQRQLEFLTAGERDVRPAV